MFIPITQELANTSPDEFEIQLEDAIPPERAANTRTPLEVLVIVPDGVAYALDRRPPGALRLRIFVEAPR
ncbi:MAG: hypothetical protein R3B09_15955 [Nannocystaceae bacterium]